ncbi:MAG TPA: helix-turn-helix transcriptional regulator [Candidatus Limnocylindrales bacterium]|nr:helix-turn-helix transcriptional regulator [Candidatus Limnocylindrales bacterium]
MFEEREPPWTGSALQLVGREVRRARHSLGWTQRDLGGVARLSQSTISRIEHGRNRTLKLSKMARLLVALGMVGDPESRAIALVARDPLPWQYAEFREYEARSPRPRD